ncbi:TIGR03943 family putative permease subunit [Actinocorallia longicatena]|uniref:DUF1980 domain-containing protein n=1 Tax=Actinocorallia longicatena TaxID=111803 RepID=A0ABP6QL25_9ACTN
MTRAAQNLLLLLLGGAVLWITLGTGEFTNYVKPGLELPLVGSALLLIVLGLAGMRRDWNDDADEHPHGRSVTEAQAQAPAQQERSGAPGVPPAVRAGVEDGPVPAVTGTAPEALTVPGGREQGTHGSGKAEEGEGEEDGGHGHAHGGPRVAWLLCLPVLGIFAIAPPELGAFTADRNSSVTRAVAAPPSIDQALPAGTGPLAMSVAEFVGRSFEAQIGGDPTLEGRTVKLIGFVAPRKQGHWYLTRLQMSCCAADAIAVQVIVLGAAEPKKGAWVEVTGVWKAPPAKESGSGVHYLNATGVTPAAKPAHPYE